MAIYCLQIAKNFRYTTTNVACLLIFGVCVCEKVIFGVLKQHFSNFSTTNVNVLSNSKSYFIYFNTSFYNIPNIKGSIFLPLHLNILSLLFFFSSFIHTLCLFPYLLLHLFLFSKAKKSQTTFSQCSKPISTASHPHHHQLKKITPIASLHHHQ